MNHRTFMKVWAAIAGGWSTLTTVNAPAAPKRHGNGALSFERFQVRWFVHNLVPMASMDHYLAVLALPDPDGLMPGENVQAFPVDVQSRFEHDRQWLFVDTKLTIEQPIHSRFQVAGVALTHPGDGLAKPMFRYLYQRGVREVWPTDVLGTVIEFESEPVNKRRWFTDAEYRDSMYPTSGAELGPKGKQFLQRIVDRGVMYL